MALPEPARPASAGQQGAVHLIPRPLLCATRVHAVQVDGRFV
jgi:hypothetical protein